MAQASRHVKAYVTGVKADVTGVKAVDIGVRSDGTGAKADVTHVKADDIGAKADVITAKANATHAKADVTGSKADVTGAKCIQYAKFPAKYRTIFSTKLTTTYQTACDICPPVTPVMASALPVLYPASWCLSTPTSVPRIPCLNPPSNQDFTLSAI